MDYSDIAFADCTLGDEGEMLRVALDRVHRQFAWKSGGLDAEQLRRQHAPSELYDLWYSTIGRYREEWGHLVAGSGLGTVLHSDPGYVATRRRRLVDILEENLQHTGQISVIREAVDGLVGNDPP